MPPWTTACRDPRSGAPRPPGAEDRRLRDVALHAATHSPFYRHRLAEAGLRAGDIRSAEDLRRLPVLGKAQIREHLAQIASEGASPDTLRFEKTNGTTGEPLRLPLTAGELRYKHALWFSGYLACGLRPWHRQAKFMIASSIPRSPWAFQRAGLFRRAYLDVTAPTGAKIAWLRELRPQALFAWGSVLAEIALALRDAGQLLDVPVIISSSDALQRDLVEAHLRGRLSDVYGAMETGPLGWPCPSHGGFHLDPRGNLVELLDDRDHPARSGRVVCTVLWRRTFPLLRYDLGDLATWADTPCTCGNPHPRLAGLDGRTPDLLCLPDGRRFTSSVIAAALRALPGIRQFQLVQCEPSSAILRIVPEEGYGPAVAAEILRRLQGHFGDVMKIEVRTAVSVYRPREEKLSSVVTYERMQRMRQRGLDVSGLER